MLSIARCSLNEPPRGTSLFYFILFYLLPPANKEYTAFILSDITTLAHYLGCCGRIVVESSRTHVNKVRLEYDLCWRHDTFMLKSPALAAGSQHRSNVNANAKPYTSCARIGNSTPRPRYVIRRCGRNPVPCICDARDA